MLRVFSVAQSNHVHDAKGNLLSCRLMSHDFASVRGVYCFARGDQVILANLFVDLDVEV